MPKAKPLMTPEQQKQIKAAIEKGGIESIKYDDYCKITPEEADKILKGIAEKEQTSEKKHEPVIKDPDSPATKFQKRALSEAVKAGDMELMPSDKWDALTKGEASKIISELHAKRPPEPATESQMRELDKLVKDGRIFPMKTETFNHLSKDKASTLIGIGRMNIDNDVRVENYDPDYVSKRNQPKTQEQIDEIKRLVADKRLNPVPRDKWNSLTQGEAGKLIYVGQQREAANELAPERDRSREQESPAPSAPEKPQKKAPSRSDDMPM